MLEIRKGVTQKFLEMMHGVTKNLKKGSGMNIFP